MLLTEDPKLENTFKSKMGLYFFTGSTEIGRIVALKAAKTLTPVTLELGGKKPCVIDKNVSIEIASKRVVLENF